MQFTNIIFLFIFLPIFLTTYFLVRGKAKNIVLVVGSVLFLAWGSPFYSIVILNLAVLNYLFGMIINVFRKDKGLKKGIYIAGMLVNVLVFITLYLFIDSQGRWVDFIRVGPPLGMVVCVLSGISFLTDIYFKRSRPQRSFLDFMVYFMMFPKILAGPIVSYHDMESQLKTREITLDKISRGAELIIFGLAKKVILADSLFGIKSAVLAMDLSSMPALTAWLGGLSLIFYIYYDFSGYIDIARGIGYVLGFELPKNFNRPFSAKNLHQFFRRWNMSFVLWLRHYIGGTFLGKNYFSKILRLFLIISCYVLVLHSYRNAWFIGFFALFIFLIEDLFFIKLTRKVPAILKKILNFCMVMFGMAFLFQKDIASGFNYIINMFGASGHFLNDTSLYLLVNYSVYILLGMFFATNFLNYYSRRLKKHNPKAYSVLSPIISISLFIITLIYLLSNKDSIFLCTQFFRL